MIRRLDNAPHWRGIRTFPFHLHLPDTDKPVECGEVFVNDVLSETRDIFSGNETECAPVVIILEYVPDSERGIGKDADKNCDDACFR